MARLAKRSTIASVRRGPESPRRASGFEVSGPDAVKVRTTHTPAMAVMRSPSMRNDMEQTSATDVDGSFTESW